MATKWWLVAQNKKTTIWQANVTEDGVEYYFNTETLEKTFDKPEELMTDAELKNSKSKWVWIQDKDEAFLPAKLIKQGKIKSTVLVENGTEEQKVKNSETTPLLRKALLNRTVDDLTLLDEMSLPLILNNLKKRFVEKSEIYTNVGNILISINPYTNLNLYGTDNIRRYFERSTDTTSILPPHVFDIAYASLYGLKSFHENQSIVISGESGAGKTEATKQCLNFLAANAGSKSKVEKKILSANPILEAFGNAKTVRNNNSSRFGKFIEIFFDDHNVISNCEIKNYLLEKVRVVQPNEAERNFHIFYQLCVALPDNVRKKLFLENDPAKYEYLKTCTAVKGINDVKDFQDMEKALNDLQFSNKERDGIYSCVSAILAFGNIKFEESGTSASKVSANTQKYLKIACELMNIDNMANVSQAFTTKLLKIRGQADTYTSLSPAQASASRDALCKFLYGEMFNWIVQKINQSMTGNNNNNNNNNASSAGQSRNTFEKKKFIGILDIFGFEIFEENSFEQLCINFTNEMLQQQFNTNTFKIEQILYKEECIKWENIDFIDNQPIIDLIMKKRTGILPLLDEELKVPNGNDKGFINKMKRNNQKSKYLGNGRKSNLHFGLKHYAGKVEYDCNGFLEKNRDTLSIDLKSVLANQSKNYFVNILYPPTTSGSDNKTSLGKEFRNQLISLIAELSRTSTHYIRCIKPNELKKPLNFHPVNVQQQLTYSGVLEAVKIRKLGYPFRLSHQAFVDRYGKILSSKGITTGISGDLKVTCEKIINHLKLNKKNIILGKTKVLYRAEEYRSMELDWSIVTRTEKVSKEVKRLAFVNTDEMSEGEKEIYLDQLANAVREADSFRVKTKESDIARKRLEEFVEARMDAKTLRDLKQAKNSADRSLLEKVLDVCKSEGYITKLVRECTSLLEKIDDSIAAMNMAKKEMNSEYLTRALNMASDINYVNNDLYLECRENLECLEKVTAVFQELSASKPNFNFATIASCHKLITSIDRVEVNNLEQVRKLYELHGSLKAIIGDLSRCKDMLNNADGNSFDFNFIQSTLEKCDQPIYLNSNFVNEDYIEVHEKFEYANVFIDEFENVFNSGPYYDLHVMNALLEEMEGQDYITFVDSYADFYDLYELLHDSMSKLDNFASKPLWGDCEELKSLIDFCNDSNFHGTPLRGQLYNVCLHLYEKITDLNARAKELRVTLEEQNVREIVEEAVETNFDSEDIHYFKDLLNGEYREFLKLQFEAAKTLGDEGRIDALRFKLHPTIKGYFMKKPRARSMSSWQKRWIVFNGIKDGKAIVSWWKTEKDELKEKKPKGSLEMTISLASIRILKRLREYCIEVNCGDDKTPPLIVAADNSVIYNQLLVAFNVLFHDECTGYLFKRARKSGKNWRKRFVSLNRTLRKLYVFDSKEMYEKAHKSGLSGNASTIIDLMKCTAHPSGLRQYGIEILVKNEKPLYLASNSLENQKKWLSEFEKVCGGDSRNMASQLGSQGKLLFEKAMAGEFNDDE